MWKRKQKQRICQELVTAPICMRTMQNEDPEHETEEAGQRRECFKNK